jgi:hypothetical protein
VHQRLTALLFSAVMMSGCSAGSSPERAHRLGTSAGPATKGYLATSQLLTSPKAPGKPASGSGAAAKAPGAHECPDVDPAAYRALAAPTAGPPNRPLIGPKETQAWIESLENQVGDLRLQLRDSVQAHTACRGDPKS